METDPNQELIVTRGSQVPTNPDVSVIVLVVSARSEVVKCLESVSSTDCVLEKVVVANGIDPALVGLADRDDIVLVQSPVNLGFGPGVNAAATQANGTYLALFNDDVVAHDGCLDRLVNAAKTEPTLGAVGCRVLNPDGTLQEAGCIIWRDGRTTLVGQDQIDDGQYDNRRKVDYCSACALLVTRKAWEAAGGLPEVYFPAYYEDSDLSMDLRSRGFEFFYEPSAVVTHKLSASTLPKPWRQFIARRNRATFVSRWQDELSSFCERDLSPSSIAAAIAAAERRQSSSAPMKPTHTEFSEAVHLARVRQIEFERAYAADQQLQVPARTPRLLTRLWRRLTR